MRIAVLLKMVINEQTPLVIENNGSAIKFLDDMYVLNESDDYALETALRLKEAQGHEITAISMGARRNREALYLALAKGADKAMHVSAEDPSMTGVDASVTGYVLAKAIEHLGFDLILCGVESYDQSSSQVGIWVANHLRIPHVSAVSSVDLDVRNKLASVTHETGGGRRVQREVPLPCLLSIQYGIYERRYASAMSVLAARRRPITTVYLDPLGLDAQKTQSKLDVVGYIQRPGRKTIFIQGTPEEMAKALVELLTSRGLI